MAFKCCSSHLSRVSIHVLPSLSRARYQLPCVFVFVLLFVAETTTTPAVTTTTPAVTTTTPAVTTRLLSGARRRRRADRVLSFRPSRIYARARHGGRTVRPQRMAHTGRRSAHPALSLQRQRRHGWILCGAFEKIRGGLTHKRLRDRPCRYPPTARSMSAVHRHRHRVHDSRAFQTPPDRRRRPGGISCRRDKGR